MRQSHLSLLIPQRVLEKIFTLAVHCLSHKMIGKHLFFAFAIGNIGDKGLPKMITKRPEWMNEVKSELG